jgi:hypothetical protein
VVFKTPNIIVMEWCYLCKTSEESIDHLFMHCMVATELRSMIFQLFGVGNATFGERYVGELRGQKGNQTLIPIWRMAPVCNVVCLEGTECTLF